MVSVKDFLKKKQEDRVKVLADTLGEEMMPRPSGKPRKQHAGDVKKFQNTEEFQFALQERLNKDEEYQFLTSKKAETDGEILRKYHDFLWKETKREDAEHFNEAKEGFLSYIESRQEMLCGCVREWDQSFAQKYREHLKTDVIRVPASDAWDWDSYDSEDEDEELTEENLSMFLMFFGDQYIEDREEACSEENFPKRFLTCLSWRDSTQFEKEIEKAEKLLSYFDRDRFVNDIQDAFYGEDFLGERLQEAEELILSGEEYISSEEAESLIRQNPRYREMLRKETEMEKEILDRIPENPIDLFPQTRRMHRHFVLHIGPTNSGKTHDALETLKKSKNGVYLGPLRLLAAECCDSLNEDGVPCSMITGEEERTVRGAKHTASTVEMLNTSVHYETAVIDEAQMISDKQRGWAWTNAILGVQADTVHVCAASYAEDLLVRLVKECGDSFEVIHHERSVPLEEDTEMFIFPESIRKHDALIVFSKWKVVACAAELQEKGIPCSIIYGAMPCEVRRNEVRRFAEGETDVVVATDAIGMGMNLPAERIVFLEDEKFDGVKRRPLLPEEVQQIAGRAGRQGLYEKGLYTGYNRRRIRKRMETEPGSAKEAMLGFAPALLGVEGKTSSIMKKWEKIQEFGGELYRKADISDSIFLCEELEKHTEDKKLVYTFATIPFDRKDAKLYQAWFDAFLCEKEGTHAKFQKSVPAKDIDGLEEQYKYCDLMYFYQRRFGGSQLDEILHCKADLSRRIMKILAEKKLPVRVCSECGKKLPWDYPYRMCQKCHDVLYPSWDDDFF